MRSAAKDLDGTVPAEIPATDLSVSGWQQCLPGASREAIEAALPQYLQARRWFAGKARSIRCAQIEVAIPVPCTDCTTCLSLAGVHYLDSEPETYVLPLGVAVGERAARILGESPHLVVARFSSAPDRVVYDAMGDPAFCRAVLDMIASRTRMRTEVGELQASVTSALESARNPAINSLEPAISNAEQSNTSVVYGDRMILKLFRRTQEGTNPDLEIGRFLTTKRSLPQVPALLGALEYRRGRNSEPMTLAVLQTFVAGAQDCWGSTLDALAQFFERRETSHRVPEAVPSGTDALLRHTDDDLPDAACEIVGPFLQAAGLLGQRTAELHVALASDPNDAAFAPEPFSPEYRRTLHQSLLDITSRSLGSLDRQLNELPAVLRADALTLLHRKSEVLDRFHPVLEREITAMRTRCHGDYHLGQVLFTGKDFAIIDFEGEPLRPISERRQKRCPLCDVAGMLRSFHYAVYSALFSQASRNGDPSRVGAEELARLESLGRFWYVWVSVAFLRSYLTFTREAVFLPKSREELRVLLDTFLLEKAIYELAYELSHRPTWVRIPLRGILQLLGSDLRGEKRNL
ncbi:MAG: putative maltokinase [Planctomycetes bacterium]|nr:putative maltokinase [Planctomycetota bacterium]